MTPMTDEESIRVQLARMEGKQDVANERLNNVQIDVAGLRAKVHDQGNEITKIQAERQLMVRDYHTFKSNTASKIGDLETWKADATGQRKGFTTGGKILLGTLTVLGSGGLGAVIIKAIG